MVATTKKETLKFLFNGRREFDADKLMVLVSKVSGGSMSCFSYQNEASYEVPTGKKLRWLGVNFLNISTVKTYPNLGNTSSSGNNIAISWNSNYAGGHQFTINANGSADPVDNNRDIDFVTPAGQKPAVSATDGTTEVFLYAILEDE